VLHHQNFIKILLKTSRTSNLQLLRALQLALVECSPVAELLCWLLERKILSDFPLSNQSNLGGQNTPGPKHTRAKTHQGQNTPGPKHTRAKTLNTPTHKTYKIHCLFYSIFCYLDASSYPQRLTSSASKEGREEGEVK
jgi:hypothetical protein